MHILKNENWCVRAMTSQPPATASPSPGSSSSAAASNVYSTQGLDGLETPGDNETGVPMSVKDGSASSHDAQGQWHFYAQNFTATRAWIRFVNVFIYALLMRFTNCWKHSETWVSDSMKSRCWNRPEQTSPVDGVIHETKSKSMTMASCSFFVFQSTMFIWFFVRFTLCLKTMARTGKLTLF